METYIPRPQQDEVHAIQWLGDWTPIREWLEEMKYDSPNVPPPIEAISTGELRVMTISDQWAYVQPGEWVIRERMSIFRFYPCADNVFTARYMEQT